MSADAVYVLCVLLATIGLFVSDRVRLDVVALLATLELFLGGQISADQAVAGLGDSVVVLIAALFVVGEALYRTGVAHAVGRLLVRYAGSGESRLIALMMLAVAFLSAFMSSTGAVAVFIPIALGLAASTGVPRERLLMPLAVGAMIGGMLTLIGTPPNLVVSTELTRNGLEGFNFFAFTPIGGVILLVGIAYMLLIGRHVLSSREASAHAGSGQGGMSIEELARAYALQGRMHRLRVLPGSRAAEHTVAEAKLRADFDVVIVAIEHRRFLGPYLEPARASTLMHPGDIIYVSAREDALEALLKRGGFERLPLSERELDNALRETGVAEMLVLPNSLWLGQTVRNGRFRERYELSVLAIRRGDKVLESDAFDTELAEGDRLLVIGGWSEIRELLGRTRDVILLNVPVELSETAPAHRHAWLAALIVFGMLALLTFKVVASVTAVLIAALAMVLSGCVRMEQAYRAINWQSIVLIAGMLPMATALDKTGGIGLIVDQLTSTLGDSGPLALCAGLFVVTSVCSQFISNTATTVLMAPIAFGAAQSLGVAPEPLLMTVALAASSAFATPVASPVNALVLGPGNYRFNDFVKVGVPLQVIALIITLLLVPVVFPFD
ncbi:MAG: SLC13 family permease [Geminicoccaceae bacterium]